MLLSLLPLASLGYDSCMTAEAPETPAPAQWETPPPRRARSAKFKALVTDLRARPGAWAVAEEGLDDYRTQAAVMALRINKGKVAAFRPVGEFEATASKDARTGTNRVFVRWVGPGRIYRDFQETGETAPALEPETTEPETTEPEPAEPETAEVPDQS